MKSYTASLKSKIAIALFAVLICAVGYVAHPMKPADAQITSAITCNLNFGSLSSLSSSYVPTADKNTDTQKNIGCTWKGIAWQIAHTVLHSLTSSVVNWINSGFNGSPSFLTNPDGFFMNVGDQVTGDLIGDAGPLAQSLCQPFALNIRLGLARGQANRDGNDVNQYRCTLNGIIAAQKQAGVNVGVTGTANGLTLGDIINGNAASSTYWANNSGALSINGRTASSEAAQAKADAAQVKDCLNGKYQACGRNGFAAMMTEPQNTADSAWLAAYDDNLRQQAAKKDAVNNDLNRGGGFLSWQSCDNIQSQGPTQSGAPLNQTKKVCTTQTPGSFISSSLSKATGASVDELNMTNDLNQVVSALFSQLLSKTLSGGLFSSTQSSPSYPGMGSYINQLSADPSLQQNLSSLSSQQAYNVSTYAQPAYQFIGTENQALAALITEKNKYQQVSSCIFTNNDDASTTDSNAVDAIVSTEINPAIAAIQASIANASTTIAQINAIAVQVQNSQSAGDLANSSNQFSSRLNALSATIDPNTAKADLASITAKIKDWDNRLAPYQTVCQNPAAYIGQ